MSDNTLNVKYKFPSDYNPVYVNGANGGVNPRGEIMINFFLERFPLPYEESLIITDGAITEQRVTAPEQHETNMIRYVTNGVIFNLDTARSLHEWLGQHIATLERLNEGGD